MTALSDYAENKLLDHILGTTTFTKPAAVYLGLFTSDPGEAAGGAEVSGNAYARQAVPFDAAASGATQNASDITFPRASGGNWGTITHWVLFDALTVGNRLLHGALAASRVVNDGEQLVIADGDLDVSAD